MREYLRPRKNLFPALLLCLGFTACGNNRPTSMSTPGAQPTATHRPATTQVTVGYDVSYPQCGQTLPRHAPLAIIGLNGTIASNFNPCFAEELAWAQDADVPPNKTAIYVHIGNPGNSVADWPQDGSTPYGTCNGGDTPACAYQYGAERAAADLSRIKGTPMIFMDVEDNYSWEADTANNRAAMEGMTATFEQNGDAVGVYSSGAQWDEIAGTVPSGSNLYDLPVWVLGARTIEDAQNNCRQTSFTTGKIVLAQIAGGTLDEDISCR